MPESVRRSRQASPPTTGPLNPSKLAVEEGGATEDESPAEPEDGAEDESAKKRRAAFRVIDGGG